MPLLCQQPFFHPRTEAISGSNWSQLTLKWPQFLGGRRAEKQAFVPGGLDYPGIYPGWGLGRKGGEGGSSCHVCAVKYPFEFF